MKKFLITFIALIMSVPAFASVGLSPTKIEINANKVKGNYIATAIDVRGDSQQPVRFRVYPKFFTINQNNEMVLVEKSNDVHDLSKRVRFVPSEFTVAQGKTQKLRINIPNVNTLPDGENRVVLFIEDINPKEMNIPTPQAGIGAQLIVKTRIGVPIYVDKGKFTKEADIEYLNISKEKDGLYTNMKVVSKGNSKIRYSAAVQIIQGKKLVEEYSLPGAVAPHNSFYIDKHKIKLDNIMGAGEYTLRMVVSYFDENGKRKNIKKETNLVIQGNV